MRLQFPLTGRTAEMRTIHSAFASADTAGVLLSGVAGVGKSRIAQEALLGAAAKGYETRLVAGTSVGRAIPLGAFSAWAPPGITDSAQLLQGVIEAVTAAPPGAVVVLAVDDVHLLDDLSVLVVHQIVARSAARVLLTVRDDEPARPAVHEIVKAGRFDRIALQELSIEQTAALLAASLAGPVESDAVERLWALTRGNALYLRTIVEQEVADGRLFAKDGLWCWAGDPAVPPGLIDIVESRLAAMPPDVRDVLDALAVGEPIDLKALTSITTAMAIEEAESHGLITLEHNDRDVEVRLGHPLYGEVCRRRAPLTRLRRLRGMVATQLASSSDHDDIRVVVRRAALSLDSDLHPDADLFLKAAHGAVWLGDLLLADRLAAAAFDAGAGYESNLLRAHALSWMGLGEEAEAMLAGIPTDQLTDADRASYAFVRSSNMLWALGDTARAKDLIDEASRHTSERARTYIDAFDAVYGFAMDQPDAAMRLSEKLAPQHLPVASVELAWALAQIFADAGRTTEAIGMAEWGYTAATGSLDAPQMVFNLADAEVAARLLAGEIPAALNVADRTQRRAAELPGTARLLGMAVAGRAALGAGDLQSACRLLSEAAAGLSASHGAGWGYRYRIAEVTALAISGATEKAAALLATLDRVERSFRPMDYEVALARAWVAAGDGAVSEAVGILLAAGQRANAAGRFAAEVLCLQTAAQFGDHTGAPRLRELTSAVEGPRAGLAARFAEALEKSQADELALLSVEFERIGDLVAAVDVAAHASTAYRRENKRGSALGCSTRAAAMAARCAGVSTPALRKLAEPVPLTDREREIVMLIGRGLSNRAVAERLTLSVRTVESHVFRAMRKTGTATRDELGAVLRGHVNGA